MNLIARYPHYFLFALAVAFAVTGPMFLALGAAIGGTVMAMRQNWKRRKRDEDDRDR